MLFGVSGLLLLLLLSTIWSLPPPLLLGVYSVRLLTRTTSLQRGPLIKESTDRTGCMLHSSISPGLMTMGGMGSNS